MKRSTLLFILLFFFGISSFSQKMIGFGGELSVLSLKPNVRIWVSRTLGFEVFAGMSSQIGIFKPDDPEAGFKILKSFLYKRTERTYFGAMGKWKWVNNALPLYKTNLPVAGIFIGKEWYIKRHKLRGIAIELGYQYGQSETEVENFKLTTIETYNEFAYIINLRYTFYNRK